MSWGGSRCGPASHGSLRASRGTSTTDIPIALPRSTMAQSTTAAGTLPRTRLSLSAYGGRIAGYTILAAVAAWLAINFIDNPQQFMTASVIGISNGALYALIALGYSLVYGIIELINFAHGDLFMLGTL